MKNSFGILMTIVVAFFFIQTAEAQKPKPFQGTINYSITYAGENLTPATRAQLPTSSVVTVKDCKTKTEVVSGPVTQAAVTDGTTKTEIILIDYMGTKYALKLSSQEITEGLAKLPVSTVNKVSDTKIIAGFNCKKAIITTTEEDESVSSDTIYYTEDIGCADLNFSTTFKDIPGAVLQYTEYTPQIDATATYIATEVKKSKVSDNAFLIPSDYKEVTKEEFKKTFGGE